MTDIAPYLFTDERRYSTRSASDLIRTHQNKNNDMATNTNNPDRAFRKGLRELRVKDVPAVRAELMDILGVTTKQSFTSYSFGRVSLDVAKARSIDELFRTYGVYKCWGL